MHTVPKRPPTQKGSFRRASTSGKLSAERGFLLFAFFGPALESLPQGRSTEERLPPPLPYCPPKTRRRGSGPLNPLVVSSSREGKAKEARLPLPPLSSLRRAPFFSSAAAVQKWLVLPREPSFLPYCAYQARKKLLLLKGGSVLLVCSNLHLLLPRQAVPRAGTFVQDG